jgi:hypothetical protein
MMKAVEMLPREFGRFRQIGGARQFAVYEHAGVTGTFIELCDTEVAKIDKVGWRHGAHPMWTSTALRPTSSTLLFGTV